ncbi:hypothetical protein CRYUN_Cryun05aG0063900 [Craigia yunnanensis]
MEIVIGIVSSLVTTAAKYTIAPIKNQIKYLSNHENKVQSLKDQVESLRDAKERVQHSVDAAKGNGEEIEHDVDKWLTTVNKKIDEAIEKEMQDEEKAKKKCFLGLCPSFWTRYKLSIKADEEAKTVAELLGQGKFDRVSYRAAPQPQVIMAASVEGFEAFESRRLVLNGIMEALKDASIKVIGVHGMGGVGKTTLVKEVARQVKQGQLFDSVVIATVTQTLDVMNIQNQIADLLRLKFEEQSMVGRALRLRERLNKEKKILVVLDDIWARLDLEKVGIPFGNENEGCKILLTSRDLNVLSSGMDTQKNFAVGLLNEEEAWDLFKKMAGDCVDSCDLQPTAIEVAKKCAGLPIAIATVARALRNKSLFEWKNALRKLTRPSSGNFTGITAAVYSAIELSYNYLESEEVKLTFLLCSLIGHNGFIQDLLKYIIGLGYFQGVYTIKEARDEVLTVVSKLKSSCLLLESYNNERFDIHDVVWSVALSIASRDHHMVVLRDGDVLKEWPDKERMNNCCTIYLRSPSIITELPDEMECSGLRFLYMAHDGSVKIPANFFRLTERLKVLDFTGMHFPSLPESINRLTNLHTLCLDHCVLEDISIIGNLKSLEILSLFQSDIEELPRGIAELTRLRLLNLSCTELKIIPPNVLSKLSKLEELYMEDSFIQWEEEVPGRERRNASLEELKHLTHLTTLYAHIPNAQIIPERLFIETLDRYRILIGDYDAWDWSDHYEYSRTLKFKLNTSIYLDHGVKILLNKTEDLYLDQLKGIKNVFDELNNGEDFRHLKKLHVQNGLEVKYIATEKLEFCQLQSMSLQDLPQLISFSSEGRRCCTSQQEQGDTSTKPLFNKQIVFPQLKSLRLSSIKTQRIWHNQLSETCSFPNLKSLIIQGCGNLERLLLPSVARSLVHLQQFEIVECKCLREIIFTEEIEEGKKDVICFPQLNSLHISDLQNLINFCSGNYDIVFPSLKVLKIERCPKLKEFINETKMEGVQALFNEKVAVPSLQRMTISYLRNVKMIFRNELLADSFCKLEEMAVGYCHQLSTIFSSTTVGVFHCLEKLRVSSCDSLEHIFELGGLNREETVGVEYSQLRELEISWLPALKHVWNNDPLEIPTFQNLRKVKALRCSSLKNLFPVSIAKKLPQLEYLEIRSCGVEEIVSAGERLEQPIRFKFPQVSYLELTYLKELKCFYPGNHATVWPMLKKLKTDYSTLLKIVASERFSTEEMNENGQRDSTIRQQHLLVEEVIPKLEELQLQKFDDIAMMCNAQFPVDLFHQIKVFKVCDSYGASASFPISFFQRFYNLEILQVSNCDLKVLVSCEGVVGEKPDASRIRQLKLEFCKNLTQIWKKDSELGHIIPNLETLEVQWCKDLINFGFSSSSFQNLTTLEVVWCEMMINLVTPSVAQTLVHLTEMRVANCFMMKEIVANSEGDEAPYEITFRKLKSLKLDCLQNLESFCPGNHTFKFRSLEELIVNQCPTLKVFCQGVLSTPQLQRVKEWGHHDRGRWAGDLNTTIQLLYTQKVGYRGLHRLTLSDTSPELLEIWNTSPQEILNFKILVEMKFCNCSSLKYIFTPSMALSLEQLLSLEIKECSSMEEVIRERGVEEEATTDKFTFPNLYSLEIKSCSNFTNFYLGSRALEFPSLITIKIAECPKMTTFSSSFGRNKEKESICEGSESGRRLGQRDLNIAPTFFSDKVVCHKLQFLKLSSINIEKIWDLQQPASSLYAQNLERLTIKGCHNLKHLFPSFMVKNFVQLKSLRIRDCKIMEEVIFFKQGLTEEERMNKILFPELEFLSLKDLPKLTRFCYETHIEFPLLTSLNLKNCPVLMAFISKSVIEDVGDYPQIDKKTEGNNLEVDNLALFNEKVVFPSLKKLTIERMRDCRKIWQDQLTVNSFCELHNIRVGGCETLLNIFSFNMMERLEELETLQIVNCDSLEEIFEPQGFIANQSHLVTSTQSIVVETEAKFVFPKVTCLRFDHLPKLKRFYSRIHATEWPSLKKMEVIKCLKVEIFSSEYPCFGETQAESQVQISNQEPLFWVNEVTFPILEELKFEQNHTLKGTWLSTDCFRKLKVLELINVPGKSAALPYCFIRSLPDLETFILNDASFCQIFQSEALNDEERHGSVLTRLSKLRLSKLPKLKQVWKEEFRAAFCNLRILEVEECGELKTLVPSLTSFENLTTLEVSRCHGFFNLIVCSAAKSLMLLERLSISDCKMMEEIIASEGEEIKDGIVFTQLKYLQLSCLPNLSSFSLGDHIFEFPALEKVIVRECPKMKNFCQGDLSTPKLQRVQLTGDEEDEKRGRWDGNLKTTIQQLFIEMNLQNSEEGEVNIELPSLE